MKPLIFYLLVNLFLLRGHCLGQQTDDIVITNPEFVTEEDDEPAVDYSNWHVLKVSGFKDSPGDSRSEIYSGHPLEELEENADVNILQEHRAEGFIHMAVSDKALERIQKYIEEKGFTWEDLNVDLGSMIYSTVRLRSNLRSGMVSFTEYMNFTEIDDFLTMFAAMHPDRVSMERIGTSWEGRPIRLMTITSTTGRRPRAMNLDDHELEISWGELNSLNYDKYFADPYLNYNESAVYGVIKKVLEDIAQDSTIDQRKYKPHHFIDNISRYGRSLNNDLGLAGNKDSLRVEIPVSAVLSDAYAQNDSIVQAIKESVLVLSEEFSKPQSPSDDETNRILTKIRNIPLIQDIRLDDPSSNEHLYEVLTRMNEVIQAIVSAREAEATFGTRASYEKPAILIDGGVHAREWISPAFLMYTLTQLVKRENDYLTNEVDWKLIPVVNPDGYEYTWTKNRMWRKNRAKNNNHRCKGVDLNRNFDHHHGGSGSSSNQCSQIYHGPQGFSEPESRAIQRVILREKRRLKAYISVHSYGQMILYPWAYTEVDHKDKDELRRMGNGMARQMKRSHNKTFKVGSAAQVLYAAAGGSDDYANAKGVRYTYTFELRDQGRFGFTLPASQILPAVEEAWAAVKYMGEQIDQLYNKRAASNFARPAYSAPEMPEETNPAILPSHEIPADVKDESPFSFPSGSSLLDPLISSFPGDRNSQLQSQSNVGIYDNRFGNVQLQPFNKYQQAQVQSGLSDQYVTPEYVPQLVQFKNSLVSNYPLFSQNIPSSQFGYNTHPQQVSNIQNLQAPYQAYGGYRQQMISPSGASSTGAPSRFNQDEEGASKFIGPKPENRLPVFPTFDQKLKYPLPAVSSVGLLPQLPSIPRFTAGTAQESRLPYGVNNMYQHQERNTVGPQYANLIHHQSYPNHFGQSYHPMNSPNNYHSPSQPLSGLNARSRPYFGHIYNSEPSLNGPIVNNPGSEQKFIGPQHQQFTPNLNPFLVQPINSQARSAVHQPFSLEALDFGEAGIHEFKKALVSTPEHKVIGPPDHPGQLTY